MTCASRREIPAACPHHSAPGRIRMWPPTSAAELILGSAGSAAAGIIQSKQPGATL